MFIELYDDSYKCTRLKRDFTVIENYAFKRATNKSPITTDLSTTMLRILMNDADRTIL